MIVFKYMGVQVNVHVCKRVCANLYIYICIYKYKYKYSYI